MTCEEIVRAAREANIENLSAMSVFRIICDELQLRKVAVRWVPHRLTEAQQLARVDVANELLGRYGEEGKDFL